MSPHPRKTGMEARDFSRVRLHLAKKDVFSAKTLIGIEDYRGANKAEVSTQVEVAEEFINKVEKYCIDRINKTEH